MDRNWMVKLASKYLNVVLVILYFGLTGCGGGAGSSASKTQTMLVNKTYAKSSVPSLASPIPSATNSNIRSSTPSLSSSFVALDNPTTAISEIQQAAYDLLYGMTREIGVSKSVVSISSSSSSSAYSGVVTFKDATLNSAVHSALGFSNSSAITTDNLKTLTTLQVVGPVTTLDGLQYAINLTEFLMYSNNGPASTFSNLEPLASLTHLKKLLLITGSFDNVDALKGLPLENVEFFDLAYLADLEGLRGNSTLKHLGVIRSPVSRITSLKDVNFAVGADVIFETTCASFKKDTDSLDTIMAVKAKGVKTTYYEGTPGKVGEVDCPIEPLNVAPEPIVPNPNFTVTAKYNNAGVLKIDWSTTDPLFVGQVNSCEIYPELDYQLPRVPLKTITNCPATSSIDITDLPYVGTNITVVIKSIGNSASVLKAKVAIDDLLISTKFPVIRAMDWGQSVLSSNPKLVQNREALFRVHVTANSPTPVPEVWILLSLNGQTKTVVMEKPASLPATKKYSNLAYSYSTIIPKEWMKPGLSINVTLGSTVETIAPTFADPAVLYLTIVPTKVMGLDVAMPDVLQIQNDLKSTWPLSEIKVRTRVGFTSQVTQVADLYKLLNELRDLHSVDQDDSYYYGFFSHQIADAPFGGLGDKPGKDAIGMDIDNINLMPHELGHNFDLGHVDCGHPDGVDTTYPYDPNIMGSFAIDLEFKRFYQPSEYKDVMSYCSPKHVSDYSYNTVQNYIARNPLKPFNNNDGSLFKKMASEKPASLFISGEINHADQVSLRRLLPLTTKPTHVPPGDYQLRVIAQDGAEYTYGIYLPQVDHSSSNQPQYFSATIPFINLVSITLTHRGKVIYNEEAPRAGVSGQQKPAMVPIVEESLSQICLRWTANETSATLIHQGERATTLFMDATNGHACVSNAGLETGGEWKIILRKGLLIQNFTQLR